MNVVPTLAKGLRIEAEDEGDWELLRYLTRDASMSHRDLADSLNVSLDDADALADWREYVLPDLQENFQEDLALVSAEIETAIHRANGHAGLLWINKECSTAWYSALNQARLAIEESYHFSNISELPEAWLNSPEHIEQLEIFQRNRFYGSLQILLLEYVM